MLQRCTLYCYCWCYFIMKKNVIISFKNIIFLIIRFTLWTCITLPFLIYCFTNQKFLKLICRNYGGIGNKKNYIYIIYKRRRDTEKNIRIGVNLFCMVFYGGCPQNHEKNNKTNFSLPEPVARDCNNMLNYTLH